MKQLATSLRQHVASFLREFRNLQRVAAKNVALKVACAPCYMAQLLAQQCCITRCIKNCPV